MTVRKGFTLSEVLIALGVIGVVAAITMPAVVKNIEKERNVSILKKSYAEVQNYIQMYANDNGCIDDLLTCGFSRTSFANYLVKQKSFKYFHPGDTWGYLKSNDPAYNPGDYFCGNAGYFNCIISPKRQYALAFKDDATVVYSLKNGLPNSERIYVNVYIYTDPSNMVKRDSSKKTNLLAGKNQFMFFITNKKRTIPNGSNYCGGYSCKQLSSAYCKKNITDRTSRVSCFQRIINDGWKIKYY